jgi:hypothetical protein
MVLDKLKSIDQSKVKDEKLLSALNDAISNNQEELLPEEITAYEKLHQRIESHIKAQEDKVLQAQEESKRQEEEAAKQSQLQSIEEKIKATTFPHEAIISQAPATLKKKTNFISAHLAKYKKTGDEKHLATAVKMSQSIADEYSKFMEQENSKKSAEEQAAIQAEAERKAHEEQAAIKAEAERKAQEEAERKRKSNDVFDLFDM